MPMVMPIREFGNAEKVRSMCMNASDPIFISRDGKEEMVLLNIALYNHLFARAEVYRKLDEGERDVAEGRESDAFAMLERLERPWGPHGRPYNSAGETPTFPVRAV